jgi:hypothetical protein
MLEANTIKKRVLLRTLGSPLVVGPFMLGMTALTTLWALGGRAGLGLFAALVGLLGAAGAFVTQLLLRGEKLANQVSNELADEEAAVQQRSLDALDQQLSTADDDPRPETALRDLRALVMAFAEAETAASTEHVPMVVEIRARVDELFNQCVHSLAQTDKLWNTARRLNSLAARKPLMAQREKIIAEVQATVKQLSETLVGLQSLGSRQGPSAELTRLREELDQSLAVAKTVEEKVQSLLNESRAGEQPQVLATNPEAKG